MDPQLRYGTTTDGLSIGYWSIGAGEVVIDAGQPPTHCETASHSRFAWSADPHAREYAALWRAAIILRDQR